MYKINFNALKRKTTRGATRTKNKTKNQQQHCSQRKKGEQIKQRECRRALDNKQNLESQCKRMNVNSVSAGAKPSSVTRRSAQKAVMSC